MKVLNHLVRLTKLLLASQVVLVVKNPPASAENMRVGSLVQEDPLEEGMTMHSSVLAWRIPYTEEPGRLQSIGSLESDRSEAT